MAHSKITNGVHLLQQRITGKNAEVAAVITGSFNLFLVISVFWSISLLIAHCFTAVPVFAPKMYDVMVYILLPTRRPKYILRTGAMNRHRNVPVHCGFLLGTGCAHPYPPAQL